MDKRTKERIEREKLKQMIQSNPKLKAFLDAATEETGNEDLKEILMPVLQDSFDKIRMQGIQTGWYAHCLRCKEKIASCKSLDEAIKLMDDEAKKAAETLGIQVDENGEDNESA